MDSIPDFSSSTAMSVEAFPDILIGLIPLWLAAFAGLLIGWSWQPRWAEAVILLPVKSRSRLVWTAPPGFGAMRVWIDFTAPSAFSLFNRMIPRPKEPSDQATPPKSSSCISDSGASVVAGSSSSSNLENEQPELTEADLKTLLSYIEDTDGGPPWQLMMEQSTPRLAYQAWCRDPHFGPTEYRTRTIIENVAPDLVRDFFWDDKFRPKWDNMLIYFRILKEYHHTGTMIVHWIRKFPFFCSNREYIIIRRIWESGSMYYCLTKGTPFAAVPKLRSPRRVDLYYSSWRIKAVESRNGGQLTASEVLLFHHEEMGIPKELAKIGIRRGMWDLIKKLDVGMQDYRMARVNGLHPSRYAIMSRLTTILPPVYSSPQLEANDVEQRFEHVENHQELKKERSMLKWVVMGGILIACGLTGRAIHKGIVFGMVKGVGRIREENDNKEMAGNEKN